MIFKEQNSIEYVDETAKLDLLWKIWPLRSPRPGWSGMMQAVSKGPHPGQSSVIFLPMIDMSATDMSCIYSTLKFICAEAKRHSVVPVITFDQPLWWKSQIIVANETSDRDLQSIVLRLGGFHVEMSFLGCIGYLMSGSGLQEVLETVYAPNAVIHMLSGKAVSRALRGHMLVDTALSAILVTKAYDLHTTETISSHHDVVEASEQAPSPHVDTGNDMLETSVLHNELDAALQQYDSLMDGDMSVEDLCMADSLDQIKAKLDHLMTELTASRTSKLWLQYMEMINLLRKFLKAERTGNWLLHLQTLQEMLPYFAAAGHNLYTKSAYIYIQQMLELEEKHPDIHTCFMSGYHVVRRSDRYWAGLSSDLVIEQTLMRSMKTSGGLTHGRGVDESQRTQWVLSMPACSSINAAMQELTETGAPNNDCHKEISIAPQQRDDKDTRTVLTFLQNRNPFERSDAL